MALEYSSDRLLRWSDRINLSNASKESAFLRGKMIFGPQMDQVVDILFHPKDRKQVATDLLRLSTHFLGVEL